MHAMLYSEYDPIIPANSTLHQSDCPPNQLNSFVAASTEAFARAYVTLPAVPCYVRHALALRHGLDVTDAALGCPSAIAPESAPDELGEVASRIAGVRYAFDAALVKAVDSTENDYEEGTHVDGGDIGREAVLNGESDCDRFLTPAAKPTQSATIGPLRNSKKQSPRQSPVKDGLEGHPSWGGWEDDAGPNMSGLSPDELIALVTSEIRG